jgi:dipeptidyl aminopeptidase/acylaminoacyl peptidase
VPDAIVNWFGITDVADLLEGPNAKHYAIEWFGSMENRKDLARRVSPLTYVRADGPPVISIHGDKDNVVPYDHAVRLHKMLDQSGVPNRLVTIPGGGHGGFSRQALVESFSDIRDFLTKNGVLERRKP